MLKFHTENILFCYTFDSLTAKRLRRSVNVFTRLLTEMKPGEE